MQLKHIEFHILVLSFSLHRAPRRRGREESRLVPGSKPYRTERRTSGDDHVEFVRAEQALGYERVFGCVEKVVAGAAEDDVDWEECVV